MPRSILRRKFLRRWTRGANLRGWRHSGTRIIDSHDTHFQSEGESWVRKELHSVKLRGIYI
jgi:hypothetical protein